MLMMLMPLFRHALILRRSHDADAAFDATLMPLILLLFAIAIFRFSLIIFFFAIFAASRRWMPLPRLTPSRRCLPRHACFDATPRLLYLSHLSFSLCYADD